MKTTSQSQRSTPCRATFITLSRNTGIPFSPALSGESTGAIASEEALMGVGFWGDNSAGRPFARVGIYNLHGGIPQFKFALNFNTEDGTPILRPKKAGRVSLSEAEFAIINWTQGSLFNTQMPDGAYWFKEDRINAAEASELTMTPEELEAKKTVEKGIQNWVARQRQNMPRRRDFAMERRLESAIDMVDKYMELEEQANNLSLPRAVQIISPEQVPVEFFDGEGKCLLPLNQAAIAPHLFRSLAVNRFKEGLRVSPQAFREIKASYIKAFEVADSMRRKARPVMVESTMKRSIESLRTTVNRQLAGLNPANHDLAKLGEAIDSGLGALAAYYQYRQDDGTVLMFTPPRTAAQGAPLAVKQAWALFERPMFVAVSGKPLQVVSDYMTTGEYPFDGRDLLGRK